MNGVRTGTKTAKTVLQSGESKKNKYVWRGVMERQNARHKGEQTDEDIKSAWSMDPESQGNVFILPKS